MTVIARTFKITTTTLLACLLIACGGGGGGGGGGGDDAPASTSSTGSNSQTTTTGNSGQGSSGQGSTATGNSGGSTTPKTSVTLSWTAPTTRQNGDPLLPSDLAGYEIYYFLEGSSQEQDQIVVINDALATEATITDLATGTYFFAIATVDSDGLASDPSDYVEASID